MTKMEVKGGSDPLTDGMRELLLLLPEDTLKVFLGTVTGYLVRYGSVPLDSNGKPTMDSRTHAIQTILMYSEPYDLLGRQKMTKAVLSDYLNQKGVRMSTPATKKTLCEDVLRHWGVRSPANLTIRDVEDKKDVKKLLGSQVPSTSSSVQTDQLNSSPNTSHSTSSTETSSPVVATNGAIVQHQNTLVPSTSHELETMEYESTSALQPQEVQLGLQLAKEFSRWFYERLNTLTDFTPAHFWPECNLRVEMILASHASNTLIDEIMGNSEISCAKLKDLVAVKQLYFNPNTMEPGVKGYLSPHGLAQVMVCGTLHQRDNGAPVGVFEQMFGLMKDPRAGNTFKIKFTVLRLREGGHLAIQETPPEICDSSLVGIIEEVD